MAESDTMEPRSGAPARREGDGERQAQNETSSAVREMPHSNELERMVLAALLDGRNLAIHTIRQTIEHPLFFFSRNHRIIYLACIDLDDRGEHIDAAAVAELLKGADFRVFLKRLRQQQVLLESNQLDGMSPAQRQALYRWRPEDAAAGFDDSALAAVGGYAAVLEIVEHYASTHALARNVRQLADYYYKRRLILDLTRLSDKAHRTTDSFQDLIDTAGQSILELARYGDDQRTRVFDLDSVVEETLEAINQQVENPNEGVQTGYQHIDDMLMSLRPGGLYVLAARPGVGKTSFALNILHHVCGSETDALSALFFSLEVDRVDLMKKLVCAEAGIEFKSLERGIIRDHEWEALHQAAQRFRTWKLDLMDVSDLTVQALRSVAKRHHLERGGDFKLIVIDYLQLLSSSRSGINEYEKISEISRTLKILAREMRIPVLALSQMSRDVEKAGKSREPKLSDLRGSGSIEQDADAVMFLHKLEAEGEEEPVGDGHDIKLVLAKNRFGPTGHQLLKFFPARQRFVEITREDLGAAGTGVPASGERHERLEAVPDDDEDLFG